MFRSRAGGTLYVALRLCGRGRSCEVNAMRDVAILLVAVGLGACGGDDGGRGAAFDPDATDSLGSDTGEPGLDDDGGETGGETGTDPSDAGDDAPPGDDDGDGEPMPPPPEMFDCSPAWTTPWVGSPCESDADCSFDGGECILDSDGYPCGTCSLPCADLCPDTDGTPETFCASGVDVGLDPGGHCLSRCDPGLLGGNGCRDGYVCSPKPRHNDPGVITGICVPELYSDDPRTDCQQTLMDLGAVFVPVDHEPESPPGFPELLCEIDEPVLLYSPINGIELRYIESAEPGEVFLGCDAAVSVVGSAAVAADLGVDEILHIGTYNCRVIAGTSTISQHGYANGIDIGGFTLPGGATVTVLDDWEDGNPNPTSEYGKLLKDFADQVWALGLWNVILTPEYNAAHDNHFHVDLTPGGNTYE